MTLAEAMNQTKDSGFDSQAIHDLAERLFGTRRRRTSGARPTPTHRSRQGSSPAWAETWKSKAQGEA